MNMDGQKQTYEQFKADIFQWKDTHREEYRRFAKMMVILCSISMISL